MSTQIKDKIHAFVASEAKAKAGISIDGATRLFDEEILDSLGYVKLLVFLEDLCYKRCMRSRS